MISSFKGRNAKDTENPYETIISDSSYVSNFINNQKSNLKSSISQQQAEVESFENSIEKRNKKGTI